MKSSTLLPALAGAHASPSVQNQPGAVDNTTLVPLLSKGEPCGYMMAPGHVRICGQGLCCSSESNTCGSDELSCSAINCLPKFSTGCAWQGNINHKLQPQAPSPADVRSSSFQKRQETTAESADTDSSSSEELYRRPSLSWLAGLPRPELGSIPYGELITTCNEPGTVALTFDDGPWEYTEDLLDILRDYEAEATFFVCGGNMGGDGQITDYGHPHLLRRMVSEGHQVGTHTWAHTDLATVDEYGILDQLLFNEQAIVQALGRIPTYFRPPYFSTNDDVLDTVAELGYHVINAGVDTNDWKGDYDAARQAFSQAVQQGSWDGSAGKIVLAHDIHDRTVHELAAYMIEEARDAGFRLVTVGECLGDSEENWYRDPRTGGSWSAGPRASYASGVSERVKRFVIPPPLNGQDKESAESLRSYHPQNSTGHLRKLPFEMEYAPHPTATATDKLNKQTARAAKHSQSAAANLTRRGSEGVDVEAFDAEAFDAESQPRMVPKGWPATGGGSVPPKATFGLVLALVSIFFLIH